jgi:hypothetical protein
VVPACGEGGPCIVFVTSLIYPSDLDGLTGADQECQARAQAASLPGVYKAWLSDGTDWPSQRFTHSSGPYRLPNGTTVAANWADLTDGTLDAPINVTELKITIQAEIEVWTSTFSDGTTEPPESTCGQWQGESGSARIGLLINTDGAWSDATALPCTESHRLYCFQQS